MLSARNGLVADYLYRFLGDPLVLGEIRQVRYNSKVIKAGREGCGGIKVQPRAGDEFRFLYIPAMEGLWQHVLSADRLFHKAALFAVLAGHP